MPNLKTVGLLVALPGFILTGTVQAVAQDDPKMCKVTVDRSQPTGTYNVQRQELENGDCICYVYTGPQPQSDTIEQSISGLMQSRQCPDAPAVAVPGGEVAASTGSSATGALLLIGVAAAAAGAVALSDGDGSSSP